MLAVMFEPSELYSSRRKQGMCARFPPRGSDNESAADSFAVGCRHRQVLDAMRRLTKTKTKPVDEAKVDEKKDEGKGKKVAEKDTATPAAKPEAAAKGSRFSKTAKKVDDKAAPAVANEVPVKTKGQAGHV